MPRKKSEIPFAERVRENQRRARVRKRELITDLKEQLRKYEAQETTRITLVQSSARKVIWENQQLHELLALKGVSPNEIKSFLQSRESQVQGINPSIENQKNALPSPVSSDWSQHRASSAPRNSVDMTMAMEPTQTTPAPTENRSKCCSGATICVPVESTSRMTQPKEPIVPKPVSSSCSMTTAPKLGPTMLEMSCETAAEIISGMRSGFADVEQLRKELGCKDSTQCSVSNVQVLQLMDRG